MESMTMVRLAELVPDEAAAYRFLETARWKGTPRCHHCHSTDVTFIDRKSRSASVSARRLWQCNECRKQFTVLNGTVMQSTKISLRIWIFVMFEFASNKNGIAAREVERRYGVTPRTAWHLLHRIREAMGNDGLAPMMGGNGGVVVADETGIGGSTRLMNNKTRARMEEPQRIVPGQAGRGPWTGKSIVLSLIDERTGEARSKVVPDVTGASLRKAIAEQVDMAGSVLYTDESNSYNLVSREFMAHETVNHADEQYARYVGGRTITSNAAESFFSQLKRSIDGTHHHVSAKHLPRYLAEFDYRHSTRKVSDTERFDALIGRTEGVRLSLRPLTAA